MSFIGIGQVSSDGGVKFEQGEFFKERILYLAVPGSIYNRFFVTPFIEEIVEQNQLYLMIYDVDQEVIRRWIP